jgi:DmsE family decaheme c-type cytochrome
MFRPPRNMSMDCVSPPARRASGPPCWLTLLVAATLYSATSWGAQQQAGAPAPPPPPADNKPAQYVGSEICQGCHEDIFNAFQKNPHHEVETDKKRGFETKACESCHGPGSKHADSVSAADIRNPAKLRPAEADRACMTCHLNQPTHVGRLTSSHAKNQVACVACHSIHKNGPNGLVARKAVEINQLCSQCHVDVWASFQRPYKHRLPEGAMSCVDCHNPHGTFLPRSIQTTRANEPGCYKCHGDKAGPFVFEHPPVKLEGCASCHEPHGSANPRMLTRAQVSLVCLECHSNLPVPKLPTTANLGSVPPAIHDLRLPRFQNCTNCHQKVHGSNVSRDLFK